MPLEAFSFSETRFFKAGSLIYKFKIRGGSSFRGEEVVGGNCFNQELEEIIRTVLGNLDSLQPFSSANFNVFPYKKWWEGASKVMSRCGERRLRAYPFSLILYLEKNIQNEWASINSPASSADCVMKDGHCESQYSTRTDTQDTMQEREVAQQFLSVSEPWSKCRRRDSPLEEAIIKDLFKDMEDESKVSVVSRPKEDPGHVDKKRTKGFDELQQMSDVNTIRGSWTPGEMHPGTIQHMGEEEEEGDEEEENPDSVPGTPVRPGILARLASHIFPFSLFFKDP